MPSIAAFVLTALASTQAQAAAPVDDGFAAALRACEAWILRPETWAGDVRGFPSAAGLADKMRPADSVEAALLPPPPLRVANRYWRIPWSETAGFVLVVSDQLPMCHITGGGEVDLQPVAESQLASGAFLARWEKASQHSRGEMLTTVFRNREEPAFSITFSRANAPGQRRDRPQIVATAIYELPD